MAARIEVKKTGDGAYGVRVAEGKSETTHHVTLKDADYSRIAAGKVTQEELIRRSFEFLLEHESKESILSQFDLTLISHYFPQYERDIRTRL